MIHARRSRQGPASKSAPLPQDRTDLNAMLKLSGRISVAGGALRFIKRTVGTKHRDGS
jgi:hypothetical protein